MSATYTLVDFMRHGAPVGGRRYRGQIDDPLSDKGWRQMRDAVRHHHHWNAIVSSPMARCREFADWLGEHRKLPVSHDERLREVGFGEWEGRSPAELREADPDIVFDFKRDPLAHRPEGAEPLQAFSDRVGAAFDDVVATHMGGHVLVVAHAGVIRMVVGRVLGMPLGHSYRLQVGAASLARIRVEEKAGRRLEQLLFLSPGESSE